jgi:hypothetical protein
MMDNQKPLRDRVAAAEFLKSFGYKIESATLAKFASIGGGPKYRKWGRRPLYAEADLLAWAETRALLRASTSEAA